MSTETESKGGTMSYCASCGVKDGDDIKLKKCAACHLVHYCGVKCQKEHRPKHKQVCKKRAAELHDEILFRQPDSSHVGDCPICFLPLPIISHETTISACCGKTICNGCDYANQMRGHSDVCPFCREPAPNSEAEAERKAKSRLDMNDPGAMRQFGAIRNEEGDYRGAFEFYSKAAELGDCSSHYHLGISYHTGEGVERDELKARFHFEQAAIGGHPLARSILGASECQNGQHGRAVKHWVIAAKLGHADSLERLKTFYKAGIVSKDDFGAALRGYQAAIDAAKSPDRDTAEMLYGKFGNFFPAMGS